MRTIQGRIKKKKRIIISSALLVLFSTLIVISVNWLPTPPTPTSEISISSQVPNDIFSNGDSASKANLLQASIFAWKEFIALNWPAKLGSRDMPDNTQLFSSNPTGVPLVWHTFRHKVEIFPGNGTYPNGYNSKDKSYGYDSLPNYYYQRSFQGSSNTGTVLPASGIVSATIPWINLDETNEIGQANMFAGVGDTGSYKNMMLYLAKANRAEYVYAIKTGWYNGKNGFQQATKNTINYIETNSNTPKPSMSGSLVSLPYGTIEVKTAWRKLTFSESSSGRFYTNKVRYYVQRNDSVLYRDTVFGMVALHIIQKTPTAPYFIFATFEQSDNILTSDGKPTEDEDGNWIRNTGAAALSPTFNVINATPSNSMVFSPATASTIPGKSLYYQNISTGLIQGTVAINRRLYSIPGDVVAANNKAHKAIAAYTKTNALPNSVWQYYKLINVQYKPFSKPTPGKDYIGKDASTYYQSNSVVESDYILQRFSGRFANAGTISDFKPNGNAVTNSYNNGKFLMGGCMGCHGNATNFGTDYSFIFGFPVTNPNPAQTIGLSEIHEKLKRINSN